MGRLASQFGPGCVELARRAGCRVLEIGFSCDAGRFQVAWVSPVPELRDPRAVEAVAALLERIAGAPGSVEGDRA